MHRMAGIIVIYLDDDCDIRIALWDPATYSSHVYFVSVHVDTPTTESRRGSRRDTSHALHNATTTSYDPLLLQGVHISSLHLNVDSSRLAIIDTQGHLTM
jgi:hypothetical protein